MPRPVTLRVDLETLPAVLAASIIACLRARGFEVAPDLVGEMARNQSQSLMIFADDESEEDEPAPTARDRFESACDDRRRADYDERHLETLRERGAL